MTDFGDFEPADAVDTDPPDPTVFTRGLFTALRRNAPDQPDLDDLHPYLRAAWIYAAADRLDRLRREWKNDP